MLSVGDGILSVGLKIATQKDASKWNEIVERDPQGNFFDRFEWCQALGLVSKSIRPLPLLIEENGKAIGVFPLCLVRHGLWGDLESLPFSDYGGGPFFRRRDVFEIADFSSGFTRALVEFGSRRRCLKLSVRRAYFPSLIDKNTVNKPIITETNTCSFIFSLKEGIDQVYHNIKPSRRRSIRQGEKRGTVVYEARDLTDLGNFHEIYVKTIIALRSTPLPYRLFEYIWDEFVPKDEAKIFIAENGNKPVGGVLLLVHKQICHAWSGGSLDQYQDKRPMDVLLWHSIRWAFDRNLEVFDLGSTPSDHSSGHYFFKETWGGKKMSLYNYHILLQPTMWRLYRLAKRLTDNFKDKLLYRSR
jgi:CelD/BcsL family acetyltransferase involved in cellulose biosynthesis